MKNLLLLIFLFSGQLFSQGVWTRKADFPGTNRSKNDYFLNFVIDSKVYVIYKKTNEQIFELWVYDRTLNQWIQRANIPVSFENYSSAGTINGKGYFGLGMDSKILGFWEYDTEKDQWNQKASPPQPVYGCAHFSISGIGFFGLGRYVPLWQYHPNTNTWNMDTCFSLPMFPDAAITFTIGTKAYVGGGYVGMVALPTAAFYEFTPGIKFCKQKSSIPNGCHSKGFSICEYGYAIDSCLYQYKPVTNTWKRKLRIPGVIPGGYNIGAAFSIGKKGYILLNKDSMENISNAFWEYTPDDSCTLYNGLAQEEEGLSFSISPNPIGTQATLRIDHTSVEPFTFSLYQMNGVLVKKMMGYTHEPLEIQREDLPAGMYYYRVNLQNKQATGKLILAD